MAGALEGVRVLDLTYMIAGPYCTKLLADFGAEVFKVETPGGGDPARVLSPFMKDSNVDSGGVLFNYLNTNKRSVTLDIGTGFGKRALKAAAAKCDVVVEDFSEARRSETGFDPAGLQDENPALVVTSIPMIEAGSPFSHWKLSEMSLYALSGLMSLVGGAGRPPIKAGGNQAQHMAGAHAAALTLFALNSALATGKGTRIEAPVIASAAKFYAHMSDYTTPAADDAVSPDMRRERRNSVLPCKDGFLTVTLYYFQMKALGELLGIPGLETDPKFSTAEDVQENEAELREKVAKWLATRTAAEAQRVAQEHRLLFTKVNTTRDLLESDHLGERGYFQRVSHPQAGEVLYPGAPFRFSGTPMGPMSPAPALGEANREFFCGLLGYSPSKMADEGVL